MSWQQGILHNCQASSRKMANSGTKAFADDDALPEVRFISGCNSRVNVASTSLAACQCEESNAKDKVLYGVFFHWFATCCKPLAFFMAALLPEEKRTSDGWMTKLAKHPSA